MCTCVEPAITEVDTGGESPGDPADLEDLRARMAACLAELDKLNADKFQPEQAPEHIEDRARAWGVVCVRVRGLIRAMGRV